MQGRNAADQRPDLNMIISLLRLSGTNHVDCSYGEKKKKRYLNLFLVDYFTIQGFLFAL